MLPPMPRLRFFLFALVLAPVLAHGAGCDVLVPPPPPEPPPPGWHLSTPIAGIRSINDVIVLEPRGDAEDFPAYHGWAVGTAGTILRLDRDADGVVTWTSEDSGVTADLESIDVFRFGDGQELVMTVGSGGTVLRRNDDGTWATIPSGTTEFLFDITFRNELDGFIVGDAGTILRWNGTVLTLQVTQTLQEVVGGTCPAEGCGANSVCDPDDGNCHSFFGIPEPLKGVGDAGIMIAVGARGAVYRYDPNGDPNGNGNTWIREDAGTQRSLAAVDTENGVTVPTIDGVLMRRNGDNDWDDDNFRVPSPVFLQDVWMRGNATAVGLSEDIYQLNNDNLWELTRVAEGAELRGVDGVIFELPPGAVGNEDGEEPLRVQEIYVVGGGGRVVRGPLVLPGNGEALLETRLSDDDFLE
jgi:hypothetical protein